jgi:hypothetical protein
MAMKRLNGWQRIGIVASILWAISTAVYLNLWYWEHAYESAARLAKSCENIAPEYRAQEDKDCWHSYPKNIALYMNGLGFWHDYMPFSLMPILLGWIIAYVVIAVVKWIKRGFAK